VNIFPGAKIIGKVSIGHNATIGLNTVVLHDVEPYTTVLGVPARVVWRGRECAGPPSALAHLEAGRQSDAPGSGPAIPGSPHRKAPDVDLEYPVHLCAATISASRVLPLI
jgi:hypothetical protein